MKDDILFIEQMLSATSKATTYIAGIDFDAFLKDDKTQSAVIMQLAVIGELAKKIPTSTKSEIDLPWKEIAGFRDIAIHEYFDVDLKVVWLAAKDDVPMVKERLTGYLASKDIHIEK